MICVDFYFDADPEALEKIRKQHADFMAEEKKVKEAERALENSMDTRQEIKDHLSSCSILGDMEGLEKKVKALSVAKLNKNVSVPYCSACTACINRVMR